jgi:hypothetical protein
LAAARLRLSFGDLAKGAFSMLSLDSPRWKELRHAYGSAEDVPALLRALAVDTTPRFSDHPAKARNDPTPWDEVYSSLCHQYSAYSATYAAFPHIVEIAEQGAIPLRLETLLLAGTIRIHNDPENIPSDLVTEFETAMAKVRRWSLSVVRQADLDYPSTLPCLLQAFGGLRCPKSVYVHPLDRFYQGEWEVEVDYCPGCREYILVEMGDEGPVAMPVNSRGMPMKDNARCAVADRSSYAGRIARGHAILLSAEDPSWAEPETAAVLAALATERQNPVLSARILDLDANVNCPLCNCLFRLAEALG